jgi:hypothetical protein
MPGSGHSGVDVMVHPAPDDERVAGLQPDALAFLGRFEIRCRHRVRRGQRAVGRQVEQDTPGDDALGERCG